MILFPNNKCHTIDTCSKHTIHTFTATTLDDCIKFSQKIKKALLIGSVRRAESATIFKTIDLYFYDSLIAVAFEILLSSTSLSHLDWKVTELETMKFNIWAVNDYIFNGMKLLHSNIVNLFPFCSNTNNKMCSSGQNWKCIEHFSTVLGQKHSL